MIVTECHWNGNCEVCEIQEISLALNEWLSLSHAGSNRCHVCVDRVGHEIVTVCAETVRGLL